MVTSYVTNQGSAVSYITFVFFRVLRDHGERLVLMDPPERRASSEYRDFLGIQALMEKRATKVHPVSLEGLEIKENGAILA